MPAIFDITADTGRTVTVTAESLADAIIQHGGGAHVRHVGYAYTRTTPLLAADADDDTGAPDLRSRVLADGVPLRDLCACLGLHPAVARRRIRAQSELFRHVWSRSPAVRRGAQYVVTPDHVPYFVGLLT